MTWEVRRVMVMRERPKKYACMCSELVTAHWTDSFGQEQEATVNMEEIWEEGATLQFEHPMRPGVQVEFLAGPVRFAGSVAESKTDFVGHLVRLEFAAHFRWSRELYEPDHFFDPNCLTAGETLRAKNIKLLGEVMGKIHHHVA